MEQQETTVTGYQVSIVSHETEETGESIYWLTLLKRANLINYNFDELLSLAEEIKRMLISSINTAKEGTK